MSEKIPLKDYEVSFSSLHVKISNGVKMPNKAIMLLSIMELIRCNYIDSNKIMLNKVIGEAFEYTWSLYFGGTPPCAWTPFWHLKNESFWHFRPIKSQVEIDALVKIGQTASFGKMQSAIQYVYLDDDLFEYIKDTRTRCKLRNILIDTYIKDFQQYMNDLY